MADLITLDWPWVRSQMIAAVRQFFAPVLFVWRIVHG